MPPQSSVLPYEENSDLRGAITTSGHGCGHVIQFWPVRGSKSRGVGFSESWEGWGGQAQLLCFFCPLLLPSFLLGMQMEYWEGWRSESDKPSVMPAEQKNGESLNPSWHCGVAKTALNCLLWTSHCV